MSHQLQVVAGRYEGASSKVLRNEPPIARYEVRGTRYEVRGTRYEVRAVGREEPGIKIASYRNT